MSHRKVTFPVARIPGVWNVPAISILLMRIRTWSAVSNDLIARHRLRIVSIWDYIATFEKRYTGN